MRYVGDMLAWLHQATASEKEYLQTLLKRCERKIALTFFAFIFQSKKSSGAKKTISTDKNPSIIGI